MDFETIRTNIEEKLGNDNVALVSDELANLITYDSGKRKEIEDLHNEVERLKKDRERLIESNGSLLQQISRENDEMFAPKVEKKEEKKPFSFASVFDEKGNFKKIM